MSKFKVGDKVVRVPKGLADMWLSACARAYINPEAVLTVMLCTPGGRIDVDKLLNYDANSWAVDNFRLATDLEIQHGHALPAEDHTAEKEAHVECLREKVAVLEQELAALRNPPLDHPDTVAVKEFSEHMANKLAMCRRKGRGGWNDQTQCTVEYLGQLLVDELAKGGDPVDVANYCMMLYQRGVRDIAGLDCNQILDLNAQLDLAKTLADESNDQRDAAVIAAKALGQDLRQARSLARLHRLVLHILDGVSQGLYHSTADMDLSLMKDQLELLANMMDESGNGADAKLLYDAASLCEVVTTTIDALMEAAEKEPTLYPEIEAFD